MIVPEEITEGLLGYLLRHRKLIQLKAGLLREPNVVVTDVPVVIEDGAPTGVDARPLIPQRTVTLVFVSNVNDATIRAVNYARSFGAAETRAIYFELDPEDREREPVASRSGSIRRWGSRWTSSRRRSVT